MPIQHAVLALLANRPSYGYELKASFEEAIGPQWGELNIGHLYQILDRLVRDGLVTKRVVRQSNRPDKTVYRILKAGLRELDGWLTQPTIRQSGYRDDFFLKLLAASRLGLDRLHEVMRAQRQAFLHELAALTDLKSTHRAEPLVELLIQAAIAHTEANLEVVDLVEQHGAKLVAAVKAEDQQQHSEATDPIGGSSTGETTLRSG